MYVYRASELGSCVRALVARRNGEAENATPEVVQGWFDRGVAHEAECLAVMEADGWIFSADLPQDEGQSYIEIPVAGDVKVTGHLDGIARSEPDATERVIEIKAPGVYKRVYDAAETGDWSDPYVSRVAWQISCYAAATGMEIVMACIEDDILCTHVIEVVPYSLKDIEARVLSVEWMAGTGTNPECNQNDYPCPFFPRVCTHKQDEVSFDPTLDSYADSYAEFKRLEKAAREDAEVMRAKILAHLGDRESVSTDAYKVTRYVSKRTNRDFKAITKAGIDLTPYETISESTGLKVTPRGDDDA